MTCHLCGGAGWYSIPLPDGEADGHECDECTPDPDVPAIDLWLPGRSAA